MERDQLALFLLIVGLSLVCCTTSQEPTVQTEVSDTSKALVTNGCSCDKENDDCGCCAHMKIDKLHIDDNACVNVTYLPDKYGVSISFTWNDKVVFNKTISASNPPPICAGVPHVKLLEVCVRLYNISYDKQHFGGCIALEFELVGLKEDFPLGCFYKSHAQIEQNYKKFRKNVDEVKRNLHDIKETTKKEINEWGYLVSEGFYDNVKTKVVEEIGSFRKFLGDALVEFGELMKPQQQETEEKEHPSKIIDWLGKKIKGFQGK